MADEYQPMGISMTSLSIGYGFMLIVWGIVVSQLADSNHWTSYIPSILGVLILIPGVMANVQAERKKLWIHIAVIGGFLAALCGTRFFMVMAKDDVSAYTKGSTLMLLITGLIYTYFCVQSFKHARRARAE